METQSTGCDHNCSSCQQEKNNEECLLKDVLSKIKHKIVVMSGKGGVGKSTVAANLALSFSLEGHRVGLLDVDIHGPSIPKMLHVEGSRLTGTDQLMNPVEKGNLKIMSIGFLLESPDSAVIWRGPMKISVIKQFLMNVNWGELDYLIIDTPPGTGDEPLSVCQFIPDASGAIIVTTPQAISALDVSKSLDFCNQMGFPVLGLVENMSGFACPKCGEVTAIFSEGSGSLLSQQYQVPLLGKLPIDPMICRGGDDGEPFVFHYAESASAKAMLEICHQVNARLLT